MEFLGQRVPSEQDSAQEALAVAQAFNKKPGTECGPGFFGFLAAAARHFVYGELELADVCID